MARAICMFIGILVIFIQRHMIMASDCKLDHMKHFAFASCEHLAYQLNRDLPKHSIQKRAIFSKFNDTTSNINELYNTKRHNRPTYLRIRKKSFPLDGYIIYDQYYANLLKSYHTKYQIVPKPTFIHEQDNENDYLENETIRKKRNNVNDDHLDNHQPAVTYCCLSKNKEKCNAEYFCRL